ncbi:MAG: phosphate acetyltransferase [Elusimicrobia bacterium]|nr:phosphate acetyltransferase [Elusimicrobiota bacterium]
MAPFSPFWRREEVKNAAIPRIAFADPTDPRVRDATERIRTERIADPILIDGPLSGDERRRSAQLLFERQTKHGVTIEAAEKQLEDPLYRGIAMLLDKKVDGLIAGSLRPTADIVRAALHCVGLKHGHKMVAGHFLIETDKLSTADGTPFLFADCAVVPEPSPRSLAAIAIDAAASYRFFTGKDPRVALLSFSTRGSAEHPLVDRIRQALAIIREHDPSLVVDGEIQLDAAVDPEVARIKKATDSPVAGKANVFVFPTLESGNIGYKLIQRFGTARIAGPLLWGLDRPMSDLSRGCTVDEITDTAFCLSTLIRRMN